jgi:hypothetical protein
MVQQYPHYLYILSVPSATQDANGNWINNNQDSSSWTYHSVCREETNGKGSTINGADGKAVVYSSSVYLPKSAGDIKEGTIVVVSQFNDPTDGVRIKGAALKFDRGQLSKRLWV